MKLYIPVAIQELGTSVGIDSFSGETTKEFRMEKVDSFSGETTKEFRMEKVNTLPDNFPASSPYGESTTEENNDDDIKDIDELPTKYTKLMLFGEWILHQLTISDADREKARTILKVYDDPDIQYDFYNTFAKSEKQITKSMKKHISQQKKLPKHLETCGAKLDIPKTRNQILKEEYINKLIAMFDVHP